MKLFSYWRSTTSFRVRIALNLKGFDYEIVPVDLVAGAQRAPEYAAINPGCAVPTLMLDDGTCLTQSLAIIDYLEALRPAPALLPAEPLARARTLAVAHQVALDIHPVNNLRVIGRLRQMGHEQGEIIDWMHHWMHEGFTACQQMIRADTPFCFGDTPDLADICLTAQMYNARRWGLELAPFARIVEIEQACLALPAFAAAHPDSQPDAR